MDALSDMLSGIRADGSSITETSLRPPWTIRCDDDAPLTMITVVGGAATVIVANGDMLRVGAGDTALVFDSKPFRLVDGEGSAGVDTTLIFGVYRGIRARHRRLLRALPSALVLHEEVEDALWLASLRDAVTRQRQPGGQAMVDRILDWGLVCTLGCWFDLQGADAPAWYLGAMDPVTGPALEAIHRYPARAWTVGSLAAEATVSRAHFAKRFNGIMGQPPLAYLTQWRMSLAEDLLDDPDRSIADVANAVGYTDPFAFSTAFKRHQGISPKEYRPARRPIAHAGTTLRR